MTRSVRDKFTLYIEKLAGWLNIISCAGLVALMLLVTLNVILRALFKLPLAGTYDISGFLTIIIIGFALAHCAVNDGHIEINYFTDKAGPRLRRILHKAGDIFSFFLLAAYTYALAAMAGRLQKSAELSVTTRTPLFIFVYLLAFCFAALSLAVLARACTRNDKGASK